MLDLNTIKSFDILSKDEQIGALTLIEKGKNIKVNEKNRNIPSERIIVDTAINPNDK